MRLPGLLAPTLVAATVASVAAGLVASADASRDPGFSLAGVGTDETFDFSAPPGATVVGKWRLRGASDDCARLSFSDWAFPYGGRSHSNLTVFSSGAVGFPGGERLVPFGATLGTVPEANWNLLPEPGQSGNPGNPSSSQASLFWWAFTPSNTLLLTGQNLLLGRKTNSPVSFQSELNPNGSFAFRYDLSRIADPTLLTNVVLSAGRDVPGLPATPAGLSSVAFVSSDERRCDDCREEFEAKLGGLDPHSHPHGSTNTVLEHLFYSGATNGTFAFPQSSADLAVLRVSVSGTGVGELAVGPAVVPLRGTSDPDAPPPPLSVPLARGMTHSVHLRGDATLSVSLASDDFAFGELPDLSGRRCAGWINFPYVDATVPCIHDYAMRQKEVSLRTGSGADDLACTWKPTARVAVEDRPPRAALLTGRFGGRTTARVSYELSHPKRLFGQATYSQTACYCPANPNDGEEDEEDEEDEDGERGGRRDGDGGERPPGICGPREPEPGAPGEPSVPGESGPEEYDDAVASCARIPGVLKLRRPPEYSNPVFLEVPEGRRRCCPCPDHATNWVAVVCQSDRLKVTAGDGDDFECSVTSVTVRVAGVRPSREPDDAGVTFAANGEITHECAYTVLGVGIDSPVAYLNALNARNSSFGLPITVTTNHYLASELTLRTDVQLEGGNAYLGFEGATAPFTAWIYDHAGNGLTAVASSEGAPLAVTMDGWREACGVDGDRPSFAATVLVAASAPGSATLVYRYWRAVDGVFVEDVARQRLTAVLPPLRADVDRDGDIDGTDAQGQADGTVFRFWSNRDADKGDYAGQTGDGRPNAADLKVNGRLDLVNFFPVQVDASAFRRAWGRDATFRLHAPWSGDTWHCAVLDGLSAEDVNALQTEPQTVAGGGTFESAGLVSLGSGDLDLTDSLRADGTAMLAFEATQSAQPYAGPELVVSLDGTDVYRYALPTSVTSVDAMYRHLNLRGAESDPSFAPAVPEEPPNLPDGETDGTHFVFVHGYNVSAAQSREWARAIFKRLWWAGSRSGFTAVDWHGDVSQTYVPARGDVSPNYYVNVRHAFMTAGALTRACAQLPGSKVMLAHSLGNMLVSAAARDHGLAYGKYYMLNAAVPREAYRSTANDSLMLDGAWSSLDQSFRASHYSELFTDTPNDFRNGLSWKGRFAGIPNAVNCYSPTEDVLANPTSTKVFGLTVSGFGGAWSKQELFKGCALWYGVNTATFSGTEIEGGWGINASYMANPLAYVPLVGFNTSYFNNHSRDDKITSPLFTSFDDSRMHETNALCIVDEALRAKMLGDAIPAESFAAGANAIGGVAGNYNMGNLMAERWPAKRDGWFHSDLKNVAFWYTHKLFEKIKRNE